jgi:alkylation response protein AidB-like acyl-CoA dehydrogenase
VNRFRTIDRQGVADLELTGVRLPAAARIGDAEPALARALDWALVMACADAVGAMGRALAITRDYLGTRRQFGTALSEFQALRHRLAEMYAELAIARALVWRGVSALSAEPSERARVASACKARIGRAAMFVANQSVQLHGGIGMTQAYVIGHYYRRLFTFDRLFGDETEHLRRFVRMTA